MGGLRPAVLVAEDDVFLADQLRWALKDRYRVRVACDRVRALELLRKDWPDLVLLDLCLPPGNTPDEGFQVLKAARATHRSPMVVVISATEEREAALKAVSEGAYDFFAKPVDLQTLQVVISRALERLVLERENRSLREQLRDRFHVEGMIGISRSMQAVFEAIHRVKDSPVTVILEGESGTGKELVSRAIHFDGSRREGPFIPVHCSALPETLLEAELFGHERGAFTGAVGTRIGRFEAADGGTLFLDEIASLTPSIQVKLLRVLEDHVVVRLGSNVPRKVDIRLIAATNEDLRNRVERGEFREDLYFRIHVFPIRIPPLRERGDDIPLLADHFLKQLCMERGGGVRRFSPQALQALKDRPWPGNVRELRNLVETLFVAMDRETIEPGDLPSPRVEHCPFPGIGRARELGFKAALEEFEKRILTEAIAAANGVKNRAAQSLGLDPAQMKYLVRKHGLREE